jgi:hypothetical protein
MSFKITNSQLVEVIVPAGTTTTTFNIPDQPQLRGKKITGVEIFNATDISNGPSSTATIPTGTMTKAYFTFYVNKKNGESGQFLLNVPFSTLHRVAGVNPYVFEIPDFDDLDIDFNKSFITVTSSTLFASAASFLFNVYYK